MLRSRAPYGGPHLPSEGGIEIDWKVQNKVKGAVRLTSVKVKDVYEIVTSLHNLGAI